MIGKMMTISTDPADVKTSGNGEKYMIREPSDMFQLQSSNEKMIMKVFCPNFHQTPPNISNFLRRKVYQAEKSLKISRKLIKLVLPYGDMFKGLLSLDIFEGKCPGKRNFSPD